MLRLLRLAAITASAVPGLVGSAAAQCESLLESSEVTSNARLGTDVSASGTRIVLGAPNDGSSGEGSATVFVLGTGGFAQEQRVWCSQPLAVEDFGTSVDLAGDELFVGAPRGAVNGVRIGHVESFVNGPGGWVFAGRIASPVATSGGRFGAAIARDGERIAVGAPLQSAGASGGSGAVYVFERAGGSWTLLTRVDAPLGSAARQFGAAVALRGGLLVVGAPGTGAPISGDTRRPGAAFLYQHSAGAWLPVASVAGTQGQPEEVGAAVEVAPAADWIAVGAPGSAALPGSGYGRGAVWLIRSQGGTFEVQAVPVSAPESLGNAAVGAALAFAGADLVAGAPGLLQRGGVVRFAPAPPGATPPFAFAEVRVSSTGAINAVLGSALDADGQRLVVGAPQAPVGGATRGNASVFEPPPAPLVVCVGAPNVTGVGAGLAYSGSLSVATGQAVLSLTSAPANGFCLGIYGRRGAALPLGGGVLCIDLAPPGLARFTGPIATSAQGTAELDLDFASLPLTHTIGGNSSWTFQCWYRDVNSGGSNLSDAVEVSFCP